MVHALKLQRASPEALHSSSTVVEEACWPAHPLCSPPSMKVSGETLMLAKQTWPLLWR